MFQSKGRLIYDPYARIKQEKWWAILKTDEGILEYYQKQLKDIFAGRPDMTVLEVTHDLTSLPVGYGTLLQLKGGKLEPHDAQTSQNTPVLRPVA